MDNSKSKSRKQVKLNIYNPNTKKKKQEVGKSNPRLRKVTGGLKTQLAYNARQNSSQPQKKNIKNVPVKDQFDFRKRQSNSIQQKATDKRVGSLENRTRSTSTKTKATGTLKQNYRRSVSKYLKNESLEKKHKPREDKVETSNLDYLLKNQSIVKSNKRDKYWNLCGKQASIGRENKELGKNSAVVNSQANNNKPIFGNRSNGENNCQTQTRHTYSLRPIKNNHNPVKILQNPNESCLPTPEQTTITKNKAELPSDSIHSPNETKPNQVSIRNKFEKETGKIQINKVISSTKMPEVKEKKTNNSKSTILLPAANNKEVSKKCNLLRDNPFFPACGLVNIGNSLTLISLLYERFTPNFA